MIRPGLASTSIFRHRDFARFQGARFLLGLATNAQSVTIGWQVYAMARQTQSVAESAFLVGMVGLVQFLPLFALTLIGGATADRHERRGLVLAALVADFCIVCGMAAIILAPSPSIVGLFALAACFGAVRAFLAPANTAMGPMLVPRDELPRAIAWNSMSSQTAIIIGPFIAGLLITHSAALSFFGSAFAYAAAALLIIQIKANTRGEARPGSRVAQIREGLAYVFSQKIVLGAISLDLFAVLLGGATALLPVFARDILHVGSIGFGALRSGPAIGAVLVALALSRRPLQRRAGQWMFGGVAVYGIATIVFALSRWLPLSILALVALGAGDMLSIYVRQSLVQIVTPDHMRGRVSAVSFLFVGASNELGEFETGVVARFLGPVGACLFGGVGSLVVTGLWTRLFPALARAQSLTRPETGPP